jgi:response regulator of citrate/malate metabolism
LNLKDIKTITEISNQSGIKQDTLKKRIYKLIEEEELEEDIHYKKVGEGKQPYIFSKEGVEFILGGNK